MAYAIVALDNTVSIATLAEFRRLMALSKAASGQLESILNTINHYMGLAAEHHADLYQLLVDLRSDLRRAQRGAPVEDATELDTGNEAFEVTPAEAQLVSKLFRKLAQKLHPDRGGDRAQFELALTAYKTKDLESLKFLYDQVFNHNRPAWASHNVDYASDRLKRLQTQIAFLRSTPDFEVAKLFQQGRNDEALDLAEKIFQSRIINTHDAIYNCYTQQQAA